MVKPHDWIWMKIPFMIQVFILKETYSKKNLFCVYLESSLQQSKSIVNGSGKKNYKNE